MLLQAYRLLYPGEAEKTVYAYWSRQAAVKLAAGYFRREYLQRFVHHKAGHRFTIAQVLQGMELDHLLRPLCQEEKIRPDEPLTHKNAGKIEDYLIVHWDQVLAAYAQQVPLHFLTKPRHVHAAPTPDLPFLPEALLQGTAP